MIHGSEVVAKDVLEYVVFEKHLSNIYGIWRLHSKILPDWLPPKEPGRLTYRVPKEEPKKEAATEEEDTKQPTKVEDDEAEEKETMLDRFGRILSRK